MLIGEPPQAGRSGIKSRIAVASALLAATGALVYSRYIEPRTLLVRSFELALPRLSDELSGYKIAFLSDFHFGGPGYFGPAVEQALDILARERPYLILLGGDFYDQGVITSSAPEWSRFPQIAPTFAVPGNHDYRSRPADAESIFELLESAGMTVLRNSAKTVPIDEGAIDVIGVDDPYTGRADFSTAERCVPRSKNPRILLTHAGMIADELPIGAVDLILSGHTHGAQIRTSPFKHTGALDLFWWLDRIKAKPISPYRQGLFWVRGSLLYVGNGIGMTTIGHRFLAPPELTLFSLFAGPGSTGVPCDSPDRYVLRSSETRMWVAQG
jgi:uncharacterized protein